MSQRGRARILQLGCGRWGANILRDLLALGCEVTVVDPAAPARAAASAAGAHRVIAAWDGASVDGVVIATPTSTHHRELARFLAGSTPVFVEKPLCDDPAQARAILAEARCPIHVMDKWRYHPAIRRLAAIARSGELGAVVGLRTRRVQWNHPHDDADALWTLAPHDLAIAAEILGRIPPLRQVCHEGGPRRQAGVLAVFAAQADTSGSAAGPWFVLEVSALRARSERTVTLSCERGVAWMDDSDPRQLQVIRGEADPTAEARDVEIERLPDEQPLFEELSAFVAFLAGGPPPKGSLAEAVTAVGIIAALHPAGTTAAGPSP